ncbi:MAG: DUF115 domain-containing protein [Leptolyngbyaceae cyanobacterium SL_5_9]|nr:DUF115 domain-containing protein [Leptolyngbyaceae cyanobacterium SL_5_9]
MTIPSQPTSFSTPVLNKVNDWQQQLREKIRSIRQKLAKRGIGTSNSDRKLLSLRNKYVGQRAFIIGNGPSLRETDLSKLKHEITIASNGIFLLFDEIDFRPTFYTVEDRLVAEDRASVINTLTGITKIFPQDLAYCLKGDRHTLYINFLRQYPKFPQFSAEFEEYVYWGGTVTYLSLQLAYYLGIREVYLVGVDHSYKPKAEVDEQQGNVITSHSNDVNHFHPDYFGPGYRWHDPKVERMEQSYKEAKSFYEANGGTVYNATIGGQLEVFPRVRYEDIVAKVDR